MTQTIHLSVQELALEAVEQMWPVWAEAYAALRSDVGTLEDLAVMARRAWERENARPGGRRRVVIKRVPRAEAAPCKGAAIVDKDRAALRAGENVGCAPR